MRGFTHRVWRDEVTINVVETEDDLLAAYRELTKEPSRALAVDTENSGLNQYARDFLVRTVQVGTGDTAWVFPLDERGEHMHQRTRACIRKLFSTHQKWLMHNAPYDLVALHRAGLLESALSDFQTRVTDTYLMAHLLDPRAAGEDTSVGHGLKALATKWVDLNAADTSGGLIETFRREFKRTKDTGWSAPGLTFNELYLRYAGLDVIYTSRLYDELGRMIQTRGFCELLAWEHRIQQVTLGMESRGVLLDVPYTESLRDRLLADAEHYKAVAARYGVENINSTAQVASGLQRAGIKLTATTPKGNVSVGKDVLLPLAGMTPSWESIEGVEPHPLAEAIAQAKRADKWRVAYVDAFLALRDEKDRVHPGLKSLAARTARMCLPESEKLVTTRGNLHVSDVRVGDVTYGRDGNPTVVRHVFRYQRAETVTYRQAGGGYAVTSTPEHRWLQESPRGVRTLRPITTGRPTLLLSPDRDRELFSGREFRAETYATQMASIVALLVTDGRCVSPSKKLVGMAAMVYQTERKFYTEIKALIPSEMVSYDRITNGEDHHEIGLRIRKLRPYLEANGLVPAPGETLKNHPGLLTWAANLPIPECAAFVRAAYLADGAVSSGNKVIYAQPSVYRDALQLCAYRCGWVSAIQSQAPGEWSTKERELVSFRRGMLYLRDRTEEWGTADVWCVQTDDGTFTAVSGGSLGRGALYLTGNSVSNPPLQQLPSGDWSIRRCFIADEGKRFVSTDFAQIELRVMAANAGVKEMIDAIETGEDLHDRTATLVFGEGFTKAQRKIAKGVAFGYAYGAGAAKIASSAGISVSEARKVVAAFKAGYPELPRYSQALQDDAADNSWLIINSFNRELPVSPSKAYAALNYSIQSSARDLFAEAMLKVADAGLGDTLILAVHDELVTQADEADVEHQAAEVARLMARVYRGVQIEADSEVSPGRSWGHLYGAPQD